MKEGVVTDQLSRAGEPERHGPTDVGTLVAVAVQRPEGDPRRVRAVAQDRAVLEHQPEIVVSRIGGHLQRRGQHARDVAVDPQLRQSGAGENQVDEHRREGEAAVVLAIRQAGEEVLAADVELEAVAVGRDHRCRPRLRRISRSARIRRPAR